MENFLQNQTFEFGQTTYMNGGRFGPVTCEHLDLALFLKGSAKGNADGVKINYEAGRIYCTYSEFYFDSIYSKDEEHSLIYCHIGQIIIPDDLKEQIKSLPRSIDCSESPLIASLLKEGCKLSTQGGINLTRVKNALGQAVFYEYFRLTHMKEEETAIPKSVLHAKHYIENHYTEACDLNDIAEHACLNPRYLVRVFKQHLGVTPIRYLWQLRGEAGVSLLLSSGLPIGEIAYQCGFNNSHHFSKYIKEHFHHAPKQLRENHWKLGHLNPEKGASQTSPDNDLSK